MIDEVKRTENCGVVCVMSGEFTQRAKPSVQSKEIRAKNAVNNGADVVLELPFPFSSMSAELFASAGVRIIAKCGMCDRIAFGSECADIRLLHQTAEILLDDGFSEKLKAAQSDDRTLSFARARSLVMENAYGKQYSDVLSSPNDILAVEYIKANLKLGEPLRPVVVARTVKRDSRDGAFASSSVIRERLGNGEDVSDLVPENCDMSGIFTRDEEFFRAMIVSLMLRSASQTESCAEVPKGSGHAILKNARACGSYEELCKKLSSKSFTDAKVRRMLLFSFLGVDKAFIKAVPLYTGILCYSDMGRKMLSESRKERSIIVSSRVSNIRTSASAYEQYAVCERAAEVLCKCRSK